jgi:cation diffusion facilitator CzcD-associated flavoprotein CzcO
VDDRSHKIALIGAGPVGLCVAKALKTRQIEYEQLEADDDVGGN